jgi:hypothetical protein
LLYKLKKSKLEYFSICLKLEMLISESEGLCPDQLLYLPKNLPHVVHRLE